MTTKNPKPGTRKTTLRKPAHKGQTKAKAEPAKASGNDGLDEMTSLIEATCKSCGDHGVNMIFEWGGMRINASCSPSAHLPMREIEARKK